jgi:hypothetical protein
MRFHSLFLGSRTRLAMAGVLVLAVFAPSLRAADAPGSPFPGLQPVDSKNVDRLYRRPDVDLSAYGKIMIGEPAIQARIGFISSQVKARCGRRAADGPRGSRI